MDTMEIKQECIDNLYDKLESLRAEYHHYSETTEEKMAKLDTTNKELLKTNLEQMNRIRELESENATLRDKLETPCDCEIEIDQGTCHKVHAPVIYADYVVIN